MAVSPTIHHGTEFLDESLWYPSDEPSPSVQSCRVQTPQLSVATSILQTSCSIDKICPLIENSEKARVIAAMALNLFVFDGKLHHSRNNWACPFGHCKNTSSDAQTLMRHVIGCPHFSSDMVYCNCCDKDDCFADQSQNEGFCSAEEKTTPCHDKGSPMKAKTMRKLTNITGFFTRSRPASRCSSRGLDPVSPTSTTVRRQSVFSVMAPTTRPSSARQKPPVLSSPEPSGRPSVSPIEPCHEMDAVSSALFEVPGTGVVRAQELPASENCRGAGSSSKRSDSGFSELSTLSIDSATAPMFADMGAMTESPTEDLSMDARIPSWDVLREASAASSRQVPHEMSTAHFPFPPASAHRPVSQHRSEQSRQSSWTFMQQPLRQPAVPLSSQSAQYGMYATDDILTNDHADFVMFKQNSGFQPVACPSSWEPTTSQYRQGSGDSGFSDSSHTMVGPGDSDSSSQPGHGRQSISHGAVPSNMGVGTCSPRVGMDGLRCPYCSYRPKGKRLGRKANLKKHIKNQHESDKISCPGCHKDFSRKDNLATHQTHACKRRFFGMEFQSARRYVGLETGGDWVDGRNLHASKRARQDSGSLW